MPDAKTTELTPLVSAVDSDVLYIVDDPGGSPVSKQITLANLRASMIPGQTYIAASGDTSGVTDTAAIQAALTLGNCVQLGAGTYYISETLTVTTVGSGNENVSINGAGFSTILKCADTTAPEYSVIAASSDDGTYLDLRLENMTIQGGLYAIDLTYASSVFCKHVRFRDQYSHGVYVHGGGWNLSFDMCQWLSCGGDGVNSVSVGTSATQQNGNFMTFSQCSFVACGGHGLNWCASGLSVSGSQFEQCVDSGIYIDCTSANAKGVSINGSYFEHNGVACVELVGVTGKSIYNVDISGCYMIQGAAAPSSGAPCVLVSGDYGTVRHVCIRQDTFMQSSGSYVVQMSNAARLCRIEEFADETNYSFTKNINTFSRANAEQHVRTVKTTVNAASGGTAQATALFTVPAGGILHNVVAHVVTAFNGNATKTLEVGVAGNIDKYIDVANFDAGTLNDYQAMTGGGSNDQGSAEYAVADIPIIATWTNTASASAGSVVVYITYSEPMAA